MWYFQQLLDQIKSVLDWQDPNENEPNEYLVVEY